MKRKASFPGSIGTIMLAVILAFNVPLTGYATDLEKKASSLNSQLNELNTELSQTITAIEETAAEIEQQKVALAEAEATKQKQYEDMKLRIKYMYENGAYSMLDIIVESKSLSSLQANIEYVQAITEYDNEMLEKHKKVLEEVAEKDVALQATRNELGELKSSLEEKIPEVQTALSNTNNAIAQKELEAELARAQELAEAASPIQPKTEVVAAAKPIANTSAQAEKPAANTPVPEVTGSNAVYTLSEFLRAGRISWNDYTFTYYSQRVLPGGSLKIPGRHVNADGYVSDGSGYICLAGSAPYGTVYDTPFGYQGKIYDRGTSGNHLDVYIR